MHLQHLSNVCLESTSRKRQTDRHSLKDTRNAYHLTATLEASAVKNQWLSVKFLSVDSTAIRSSSVYIQIAESKCPLHCSRLLRYRWLPANLNGIDEYESLIGRRLQQYPSSTALKLVLNSSVKLLFDKCSMLSSRDDDVMSGKDGVELESDMAGEVALESSEREASWREPPVLSSPSSPLCFPCPFSRFRRYLARAFWNHTWNRNADDKLVVAKTCHSPTHALVHSPCNSSLYIAQHWNNNALVTTFKCNSSPFNQLF